VAGQIAQLEADRGRIPGREPPSVIVNTATKQQVRPPVRWSSRGPPAMLVPGNPTGDERNGLLRTPAVPRAARKNG
jgi:hypothetical protein